jgi:hypothetical protein
MVEPGMVKHARDLPAIRRLRQEDYEFKTSLGSMILVKIQT